MPPATPETYTLSLHDALPISHRLALLVDQHGGIRIEANSRPVRATDFLLGAHDDSSLNVTLFDTAARNGFLHVNDNHVSDRCGLDRKSTRLNSSHVKISYAVF